MSAVGPGATSDSGSLTRGGKTARAAGRRMRRRRLAETPAGLPRGHDDQDVREIQRPVATPCSRQKIHRLRQERDDPRIESDEKRPFCRDANGSTGMSG